MAVPSMTNNSPSPGHIAWGAFTIQYNGVGYQISAGSTSARWVWWRYNGGSSVIEAGADIPTDLTDDDLVLFGNKNGIGIRVQSTSFVDGELLVDGSIFAQALAANQISTGHIVAAGLDAGVVKFGTMSGQRIEADSITTAQLAAGAVTALELATGAVTTDKLAAGSITADLIASGNLQASLALLGELIVGDESGRRIILDPDSGFQLVDSAGEGLVHFPLASGGLNKFVGDIDAEGLTVRGAMSIRGIANEIAIQSALTMQTGVTKPSNYVSISSSHLDPVPNFPVDGWHCHESSVADDGTYLYGVVPRNTNQQAYANNRINVQRHRWSDGVRSNIPLTFMNQTGYSDAEQVDDPIPVDHTLITTSSTLSPQKTSYTEDPREELVDGYHNNPYFPNLGQNYVSQPAGWQWVQLDLGSQKLVSALRFWHFYEDGRRYNRRIEVSADGVTWEVVLNTATQGTTVETSSGILTSFTPRMVRYVREYLNGSTANTGNHWAEIDVFGSNGNYPVYAPPFVGLSEFDRITVIGNYLYLAYDVFVTASAIYQRRIGKFDKVTGQQVAVLDYHPFDLAPAVSGAFYVAPGPNMIALCPDGTNLIVAQIDKVDGKLVIRSFNPDSFTSGPTSTIRTPASLGATGTDVDVIDITKGTFDFGSTRYIVRRRYSGDGFDYARFWVYDASGVLIEQERWQSAATSIYSESCSLIWRNGRFMMSNLYQMLQYSTNKTSEYVYAAYSFYDSDSGGTGTHETEIGPVTSAARKPRYGLTLTANTGPVDTGDPDSPNTVRIYAMQGTYTGVLSTLKLQALTSGRTAAVGDTLATATVSPTAVNTFPSQGAAAQFKAAQGGFIVRGDSTGAWPALTDPLDARLDTLEAQTLDARLDAIEGQTLDNRLSVIEGQTLDARLDAVEPYVYDTGWVNYNGGVGEAPFATSTTALCQYRRIGRMVHVRLQKSSTAGRDMSANTNGNFTNIDVTAVYSLPEEVRPTQSTDCPARMGDSPTTLVLTQSGAFVWTGGYPRNYAAGSVMTTDVTYFLD